MIYICSWCPHPKMYRSSVDGSWRMITTVVLEFIRRNEVEIGHGICDACHKVVSAEIDFEEKRKEFLNDGNL